MWCRMIFRGTFDQARKEFFSIDSVVCELLIDDIPDFWNWHFLNKYI